MTPRILPGVTAIGQGAWLKADMFGDRVDHGGSINILTSHRPSPLAKETRRTAILSRSKRFKE